MAKMLVRPICTIAAFVRLHGHSGLSSIQAQTTAPALIGMAYLSDAQVFRVHTTFTAVLPGNSVLLCLNHGTGDQGLPARVHAHSFICEHDVYA